MSKKETSDKVKALINIFESVGVDTATATKRVTAIINAVNKTMESSTDSEKDAVVSMKVKEQSRAIRSTTQYNGICVASGDLRDMSDYTKKIALESFEEDPDSAIEDGLIKMVKGEPVPLDTKEFLDKDEKWANKNFGKPIKNDVKREMFFIKDNIIVRAFGNPAIMEVGNEYQLFAKEMKSPTAILNLVKTMAPIPTGQVTGLFDLVDGIDSDFKCDVEDLSPKNVGQIIIVKGTISVAIETKTGGAMIILSGEDVFSDDIACFIGPEGLKNDVLGGVYDKGDTVYIFGKLNSSETEEGVKLNINAVGMIKDDSIVIDRTVMDEIDELISTGDSE
ncbi:MAG: hypothetical protein KAJ40_09020 [Alphaproteobacteria bacterium]|nr:hypothetical protein [Alphaproteobacteria bacterium]